MINNPSKTGFYDALACLVIQLDREANVWFMNRFALDLLGYEHHGQVSGQALHSLLPHDDAKSAELLAIINTQPIKEVPGLIESDLLRRDGARIPVAWNLTYQGKPAEELAPTVLVGFDASLIRNTQAAATMFQTVSDNYTGSIVIASPNKTIIYANPALLRMTGYTSAEVVGQTPALFKSGETANEVYQSLWSAINAGDIWNGEFINRRKDGTHYHERKTLSAIRDAQGSIQFYFAIGEDLSQRQKYQQRIETLLTFDQLTGLPNRNAFLYAMGGVLEDALKGGKQATILHIDLDDFFGVNDQLGADDADQVIAEIAQRIKGTLRHEDRLARLGNDKFAIMLGPHESDIDDDIRDVAERVMASIGRPLLRNGKQINVTASIGIAAFPNDGDSASELLSHAINATERVKSAEGNNYCRFDATIANTANSRRELLNELRLAIENNELILHFQPQVSLFSGAIIGMEALIRWQHPQRGLLQPGSFIPLAEQSDHIIEIGEWVLHESCRQMRAWLDADVPVVKVAINLAARHFVAPGLPTTIADALARHRIDPRLLEIEITEGAMMLDVTAAIRSTTQLKDIGVRISLDDFGTGYSSLAYLSRFPIDVVKIDQSFVRDITSNPVNAAIAQATIAMSHKLDKTVLAEGVETEEQMLYLRRNECDEMQGYFFSKPLPADKIAHLLQQESLMNLAGALGEGGRSSVLLVDDEANILASLKRALHREGYNILTAQNATEGFSLLAKHDVHVIITDQRMSEMNGTEFLSRVKNLYPNTVRMVLSGYSDISAVTDSINKGAIYRFMLKPWDDERLKEEVSGAFRHWRELYGPGEGEE